MRTIVFVGCNKSGSSREAVRAAERLGYLTVLLTNRDKFLLQRFEFPDVHQMILCDLSDQKELAQQIERLQAQGKRIDAIVSFLEAHVLKAAELSEKYCKPLLSTMAIRKMEDKIQTRETLRNTSYCPYYSVYELNESLQACIERTLPHVPVVIKSPTSTGSKDVLKAMTKEQLQESLTKLRGKFPDQPLLIEEYLDGPQYLVEAVVVADEVHLVAVIEQNIQLLKRFIVMGYDVLTEADLEPSFLQSIRETVSEIVDRFRIRNGALHLEMRYVRDQWKLIEVNPRISGGAMNRMIEVAKGINLVEETLKLMLGQEPNLKPRHDVNTYTQYLTVHSTGILERVTGRTRAQSSPGVVEVYIKVKQGQRVRMPESMGDRCAYVIATGETREMARLQAQRAAREIRFQTRMSQRRGYK